MTRQPFYPGDIVQCVRVGEDKAIRLGGVYTISDVEMGTVVPVGITEWGVRLEGVYQEPPFWGHRHGNFRLLSRPTDLTTNTEQREREPA